MLHVCGVIYFISIIVNRLWKARSSLARTGDSCLLDQVNKRSSRGSSRSESWSITSLNRAARECRKLSLFFSSGERIRLKSPKSSQGPETRGCKEFNSTKKRSERERVVWRSINIRSSERDVWKIIRKRDGQGMVARNKGSFRENWTIPSGDNAPARSIRSNEVVTIQESRQERASLKGIDISKLSLLQHN